MFRVGVAALVFVGSFHPPVQSQRVHKADWPIDMKTAVLMRAEIVLAGTARLAARPSEIMTRPAQP